MKKRTDPAAGLSPLKTLSRHTLLAVGAFLVILSVSSGDGFAHPPRHHGPHAHPHGGGHGARRARIRPANYAQAADVRAYQLIQENILANGDCTQLGNSLRRLSNKLIRETQRINRRLNGLPPVNPNDPRVVARDAARRRVLNELLNNSQFWESLWDRMADMYRSCDMECFDEGAAIGEISGLGYCSVSVQAGGLLGPGFAYTPPLPVCQTAVTVACQSAYREAARSYEGCEAYASGSYLTTFREYWSQDCSE
ncbi:MAG: hypothetical protein IT285_05070 [Bdellovibrionales bacterium]|nr:hypothetical protein [Bdellovibrionales bacterium]